MNRRGRPLPALLTRAARGAALLLALAAPATARADGGLVRASVEQDGLTVTLFTAPTPLRAGVADVSVLVQDARSREPLLDAQVTVHLAAQDGAGDVAAGHRGHHGAGHVEAVRLTGEAASNKILKAARVELPEPGRYRLRAEVRRGAQRATAAADVEVAPPGARWREIGWALAVPPVAIVLFAVHQALRRRREGT